MILITVTEKDKGLRFNKRRVSKDSVLIERIKQISGDKLYVSDFSSPLFGNNMHVFEELSDVPLDAYLFVEESEFIPDDTSIDKVYLFNWNRKYPSDEKLNFDLNQFKRISKNEFPGSSHEKITEEVYEKK